MRTIQLIVEGMRCRRCVRQVSALIRDVPGIAMVVADSTNGSVTVTGDLTDEAILDALGDTTFTVLIQESRDGPTLPMEGGAASSGPLLGA